MDSAPLSNNRSDFEIEKNVGFDKSMIEYAKMIILYAFSEYKDNFYKMCEFVSLKFEEKYEGSWGTSIIKDGDSCYVYIKFCLTMKYKDYTIKINKLK